MKDVEKLRMTYDQYKSDELTKSLKAEIVTLKAELSQYKGSLISQLSEINNLICKIESLKLKEGRRHSYFKENNFKKLKVLNPDYHPNLLMRHQSMAMDINAPIEPEHINIWIQPKEEPKEQGGWFRSICSWFD